MKEVWTTCVLCLAVFFAGGWMVIAARRVAKRRVAAAKKALQQYGIAVVPEVENTCCADDVAVIFTDGLYPESVFCSRCGTPFAGKKCQHDFWESVRYQLRRSRDGQVIENLAQAETQIRDALQVLDEYRDLWVPKQARQPPPS